MGQYCSRAPGIHGPHGTELIAGAVYEFHKPLVGQPSLEIVFMHGLQMGDFKLAYWKTWRTPHGEVWPMTWLGNEYKNARILSLCYDTSVWRTSNIGNTTPIDLSDSILHHMMAVKIGQSNCPVMFVCHSLGGLLAKRILLTAVESPEDFERRNLLSNFKAIFFYATPHGGSNLATFASFRHIISMSPMVTFLKKLDHNARELNEKFMYQFSSKFRFNDWKLYIVAEGAKTKKLGMISAWVVHPKSARTIHDKNFLLFTEADHSTVCKPKTKTDKGYCHLIKCMEAVLKDQEIQKKNRVVNLAVKTFGIDDKVKSIHDDLENVSILGLIGMGGAGKTTLSKAFYNSEAHLYKKSSYLENASHGLQDLQKKLFVDLFPYEQVDNRGIQKDHFDKIRQCLETEKVLIVVDDVVAQQNTLKDLQILRKPEVDRELGQIIGSPLQAKVIVTSRNRDVLDEVVWQNEDFSNEMASRNMAAIDQISSTLEIEDLEEVDSQNMKDSFIVKSKCVAVEGIQDGKNSDRDLFYHYAFHGVAKDESEKFKEIAEDIVGRCQGLPLSLEVIGKYLGQVNREGRNHQSRLERWKDTRKRFREAESIDGSKDDKLWSCLRISYDNLGQIEQGIFLALACICSKFSWPIDTLNRIWKSPNAIEHLIKRSLLQLAENDLVSIHNQLRDMGQNISKLMEFGGPYLWEKEKIMDFIKTDPSFATLKGVSLVGDGIEEPLTKDEVDEDLWASSTLEQNACQCYSKLELLSLSNLNTQHVVEYFLFKCSEDKLRWLHLDSLRITPKGLQQIWSLRGLRVLSIWKCLQLEEIPSSLGDLTQLEDLRIVMCHALQNLPETMDSLKQLQILVLRSCSQLSTIPAGVGQLSMLEILNIEDCQSLEALCEFEEGMESLQKLRIVCCNGLKHPIKGLGKLRKLQHLFLHSTYLKTAFDEIPVLWEVIAITLEEEGLGFPNLEMLSLPLIPKILPSCPKLYRLLLDNGTKLEEIPNDLFMNLPMELEYLILSDYYGCLRGLPNSIGRLVGLTELHLFDFPELMELPDDLIQPLSRLEGVMLFNCKKLIHLPPSLADLPHLSTLYVYNCNAIQWGDESQRTLKKTLCEERGVNLVIREVALDQFNRPMDL